jgi:predicted  nucleic acid-binding Zn-ribbon protein
MAKEPTIGDLRAKEWTLSSKIGTKTEEYRRRKEAILEEKRKLEALREDIMILREEHQELREEIKDLEGY